MKNILFITGTRADFGKIKPLIKAVELNPRYSCNIFVTGMHLLDKYGKTIREIERENFNNIFPFFNQSSETSRLMDHVLANTIKGLSFYVTENRTDLIVVHGDRIEALAGAIVGALQGIRTAHIEGGEVSGTVDELIRHAVTKLAHKHFVASERNKQRLLQMGENEADIYVIGSPNIDIMLGDSLPKKEEVFARYGIDFDTYSIFTYHPVVTELDRLEKNIDEVVSGIESTTRNYIVIYPNNDKGSEIIFNRIKQLKNNKRFKIFSSVQFESFLILLKNADMIVGNSSSGIHEAPVFGVPTINIGTRQNNRFMSDSITNVPEDRVLIQNAINRISKRYQPIYEYGHGNSAQLFIEALQNDYFWSSSLQKTFVDAH